MGTSSASNITVSRSQIIGDKVFGGSACKPSQNAARSTSYAGENHFLDLMKQSNEWETSGAALVFDSNGYPILPPGQAAATTLSGGGAYYEPGDYFLVWEGDTDDVLIESKTNTLISQKKIQFNVPDDEGSGVHIRLRIGATVTKVSVYPVQYEANFLAGELWDPRYVSAFVGSETIRVMDNQLINASYVRNIGDDTSLNSASWLDGPGGRGVPIEACAALCNQVNANIWAPIPHQATDAYLVDYFTRLKSSLRDGLKAYIEYCNEHWNSDSDFGDAFIFNYHGVSLTLDVNIVNGVFDTQGAAHGHTTGDSVVVFNTQEYVSLSGAERNSLRLGNGEYRYVIVRSPTTFELADSNADALAGTAITLHPNLTHIVYKVSTGYASSAQDAADSYAKRSREVWAIADSILGRDNVYHVIGAQSGGVGKTTALFMTPEMETLTDFVAIAPYADVVKSLPGYETATVAEISTHLTNQLDELYVDIRSHAAYTNVPLIAYEGNIESFPETQAGVDKINEFYDSPLQGEWLKRYFTMLANAGIEEMCVFQSHDGVFGMRKRLEDTTGNVSLAWQEIVSQGGGFRGEIV